MVTPCDPRNGVEIALRTRQSKSHVHLRAGLEGCHGPDSQTPLAQVERRSGRDRLGKPKRDWNV